MPETATSGRAAAPSYPITATAVAALALGWLVPGAGHLLLRRWTRGALLLVAIVLMFAFGLMMEGKIYEPNTGEILDMLGFVGDIGAGGLYILSRMLDFGQGAIHRATADYGTKFLIAAGLLNVIAAIDAYHIAIGKKK